MPKLLLFVPCEKPLLGADNSLSLINILQSVTTIQTSEDLDDRAKAATGSDWYVVAVWQQEPGDGGSRFQQRVTMTDPEGKEHLQTLTEFDMPKLYHRNLGRIHGFPAVRAEGECLLTVSVRNMKDKEWTDKGTYPLKVNIRKATITPTSPSDSKQTH